mmetsp:Transcript_70/g.135  ORF Transcript_70/g.135 Transcript_70/m.135 type:complete len:311 (-) Transcript_70:24-956(-)
MPGAASRKAFAALLGASKSGELERVAATIPQDLEEPVVDARAQIYRVASELDRLNKRLLPRSSPQPVVEARPLSPEVVIPKKQSNFRSPAHALPTSAPTSQTRRSNSESRLPSRRPRLREACELLVEEVENQRAETLKLRVDLDRLSDLLSEVETTVSARGMETSVDVELHEELERRDAIFQALTERLRSGQMESSRSPVVRQISTLAQAASRATPTKNGQASFMHPVMEQLSSLESQVEAIRHGAALQPAPVPQRLQQPRRRGGPQDDDGLTNEVGWRRQIPPVGKARLTPAAKFGYPALSNRQNQIVI